MRLSTSHRRRAAPRRALLALEREACADRERALALEWLETDGLGGYAASTVALCPTRRYHGLLVGRPAGSAKRHVWLARYAERLVGPDGAADLGTTRFGDGLAPRGWRYATRFELAPWPAWRLAVPAAEFGGEAAGPASAGAPARDATEDDAGDDAGAAPGASLVREVQLVRGAPVVLVRYRLEEAAVGPLALELRPLLAFREADALTFANEALDEATEALAGGFACRPYPVLPRIAFTVGGAAARFAAEPDWVRGVEYAADLARGYEGHEDAWSPGVLELALEPGAEVVVAATVGEPVPDPLAAWERAGVERAARVARVVGGVRTTLGAEAGAEGPAGAAGRANGAPRKPRVVVLDELTLLERAAVAADDFLYRAAETVGGAAPAASGVRTPRLGVCAGWPWFGEWGRDTFLSLPGLLLPAGRVAELAEALCGAVPWLRGGLLPNVFGTGPADSDYGSADAALWFARAVWLLDRTGAAPEAVRETLAPALEAIAESYLAGTELGLFVDEAGLLHAGSPELNPTWMDARVDGVPVTPRHGYPVEIEALWYQLVAHLEEFARRAGAEDRRERWRALRLRAAAAFHERLWLADERRLADGWRAGGEGDGAAGGPDESLRPNMVIAAALEKSPLTDAERADVVRWAERELVTPRGLRTLAPGDPAYVGRYRGGPAERDRAYHQGTVWPWLLGFYTEAALRAEPACAPPERRARRAHLAELWAGLADELGERGLGHVSEVFDGDVPAEGAGAQRGGGCFAQAWSTAEMARGLGLLAGWGA